MPTPVQIDAAAAFKQVLDRCGLLLAKKQASDAEPWREELDAKLELIREHYKDHAADLPIRAEGNLYFIDLTKRENKRTVSNHQKAFDALKKAMGITALVKALKISFTLLDKHVAAADQAKYVTQARTGSRDVSAVLKVQPAA